MLVKAYIEDGLTPRIVIGDITILSFDIDLIELALMEVDTYGI